MCKKLRLLRRLENNPASYHKLVRAYKMRETADKIDLFQYLMDVLSELAQEDVDALAAFSDPLAVVADLWYRHHAAMCGYDHVLDFLADIQGDDREDEEDEDYDFDGDD